MAVSLVASCSDPLGPEQEALDRNLARWRRLAPAHYSYRYHLQCFCGPALTRPMILVVRDGEVAGATYVETGEPVDQPVLLWLPTVEGLFERIREAIDQEAEVLVVEYDEEFGYPTLASVDISRMIADEEYSFTASQLEPLDSE